MCKDRYGIIYFDNNYLVTNVTAHNYEIFSESDLPLPEDLKLICKLLRIQ